MSFPAPKPLVTIAAALLIVLGTVACDSEVSSHEDGPQSKAAVGRYRSYIEENSALLTRAVQTMLAEIKAGEVTRTQSRYARARVRYGQVEPFASTFGRLDQRIDARLGEVPASGFRGFHRIEKSLWVEDTTHGMTPVAEQLLDDVKELGRRLEATELQPARIVEGAGNVLAGAASGQEEPYADIDLVDVAANVEGVEAAFEAVKPLLADSGNSKKVEGQIRRLYAKLGEYGFLAHEADQPRARSPGVSFVLYSELTGAETRKIARLVEELARLLSRIQAEVAEA